MSTITKTFTENTTTNAASNWTVVANYTPNTVIVNSSTTQVIIELQDFVFEAAYDSAVKNRGVATIVSKVVVGNNLSSFSNITWAASAMQPNIYYPLQINTYSEIQIPVSYLFNSNNPTTRSIPITLGDTNDSNSRIFLRSYKNAGSDDNRYNYTGSYVWGQVGSIELNAPPTIVPVVESSAPYFVNTNPYTVDISDCEAKFGGNIQSVQLIVGDDSAIDGEIVDIDPESGEISGEGGFSLGGTLSVMPTQTGIFTPVIVVTDSRGQSTTVELNPITVLQNSIGINALEAERIDATTGTAEDEGTGAVVELTINYVAVSGNYVLEPVVTIDGNTTTNVVWYEDWDENAGFSNPINWASYAPSSSNTIYGKLTDTFTDTSTYVIGVTARSTYLNSTEYTTTLPQAFYLLVGRAGGHGLGIGMKPLGDALYVDMASRFLDDFYFDIDTTASTGTTDGDLYAAITALAWESEVME